MFNYMVMPRKYRISFIIVISSSWRDIWLMGLSRENGGLAGVEVVLFLCPVLVVLLIVLVLTALLRVEAFK